ncbi:hypothetical protein CEUSTIGMA_g7827.t1 [Chlamydomonas eustigma]|uniref:Peptidase A2 domain-containing protein n=1 Tax=Chlamydomonas eustigma TaxID=1157962 RepID=A0A250XBD9_9CHLO|nr:hypothetical protein CEUSTIGMA_g7827.t1 [Chlamydomonas eustigma]|eukprot:GAX80388.1 hypothetical protein CEUSTIGMA_g7827.t1 [Chlamydomonas eustigma]
MKLRKLPQRTRGSESSKSHLAVPVDIDGIGFYDFLIDSGSSGILITAELRSELGISPTSGRFMNGLDCTGRTVRQKIELPCLRLGPMELQLREAVVTKLELSHEIGGVLGLSFLRQVEMVVDVEKGVIEFHPLGHAEQGFISIEGMTRLDLSVGKGGLAVVPASLNGSPFIPAIIDISATTSIINAAAATFADIAQRPPTPPLSTSRMRCHITHNQVDFDPFLDVSLGSPTELEGENNLGADEEASSSSSPGCEAEGRTNAVGAACFGQFNTRIPQPIPVRELPGLESMGLSNLPLMILGMDLMCGSSRAVFCFGSNALYIKDKI